MVQKKVEYLAATTADHLVCMTTDHLGLKKVGRLV